MHTFYEFFAGGGMARAGLGDSWQCLLANDISAKKAASYAANWGSEHLIVKDIHDLRPSELPGHADMCWGSFPCQDLSLAGNGAGLQGARSGAFWGYWALVQGLKQARRKPRTVVLENVYGALTSHGGRDFQAIIEAIEAEGYLVGAMVIDAVHFLPQSRPRLFIVGIDKALGLPPSVANDGPNPAWHPGTLVRAFNELAPKTKKAWRWWDLPRPEERLRTLDDIVEREPKGVTWHTKAETSKLLKMMTPVNRQKVMLAQKAGGLKVGTIYRRTREGIQRAEVRFDGIAGCLRTPTGGSSRQTIIVVDNESVRTRLISPREVARLMGLDDSYVLPERYNDAYHLAGDGIAVPVAQHISRTLLEPILNFNRLGETEQAA